MWKEWLCTQKNIPPRPTGITPSTSLATAGPAYNQKVPRICETVFLDSAFLSIYGEKAAKGPVSVTLGLQPDGHEEISGLPTV